MPVCPYCGAVAKHYGYQCRDNPKNKCNTCGSSYHSSLMCPNKARRPLKKESDKTKSRRTAVSRLWFELNPPDARGLWYCYLRISPDCPHKLTRSTITLEHVKSKVRYPELKFEVTNLKPACSPCNKLKGSLDVEELSQLSSVRIKLEVEEVAGVGKDGHQNSDDNDDDQASRLLLDEAAAAKPEVN